MNIEKTLEEIHTWTFEMRQKLDEALSLANEAQRKKEERAEILKKARAARGKGKKKE